MKRVFISSVINGFEAHRAAAKTGIELMGHVPVMSEEFGARPYSSRQACLTEVERSDVFLVVLGQEFGFETEADVSVTQAEFRHACAIRRPILVFVQNTKMGEQQSRFRREVEDFESGFFRATFSTPEDLKNEVIRGLRQLEEAGQAWPEERFLDRVEKAVEADRRAYRSREACLSVAFLPQPEVRVHLPELEAQDDALFTQLCDAGLASLRNGYEMDGTADSMCIRSRETELRVFEDGLRLIFLNPRSPKREGFSFNDMFVPPTRVRALAMAAFELLAANSGWCQISLRGMQHRAMRELPAEGTTSVSIPMSSEDGMKEQRLFQPLTRPAYEKWVEQVVARFARRFRG